MSLPAFASSFYAYAPSCQVPEAGDERRRFFRLVLKALATFVAFLVVGNLVILGATAWARRAAPVAAVSVEGVKNFRVVDDRVWRGSAPNEDGYRNLAARGVTTVVDLRAENDLEVDDPMLAALGIERFALPVRDGQTPTDDQIGRFLDVVRGAPGTIFVHCGAGVGRTGSMVGAYLVATDQTGNREALLRNLAVGPPSLEQIAFVGTGERGNAPLVAASRLLDGPRRLYVRYLK